MKKKKLVWYQHDGQMIYATNSDYYYMFSKAWCDYSKSWNAKHGDPKNPTKLIYVGDKGGGRGASWNDDLM